MNQRIDPSQLAAQQADPFLQGAPAQAEADPSAAPTYTVTADGQTHELTLEQLLDAAARGLSAGGALFALISLRAVLLLGAHTAALLPYPNFAAAGLAAVGDFARHGEVFFSVPLVLCDLGRAAALACVLLGPFAQTQKAFRAQKKDA